MPHCPVELTLNLTFREVINAEKGNSFVTGRHLKTCWRDTLVVLPLAQCSDQQLHHNRFRYGIVKVRDELAGRGGGGANCHVLFFAC